MATSRLNGKANGTLDTGDDEVIQEAKKTRGRGKQTEMESGPKHFEVPRPVVFLLNVKLIGISPLCVCKFDEKSRNEIEQKTEGKAKNKRAPKDPEAEWNGARYISEDGWDGLHSGGLRACIISAARCVDSLTMAGLKSGIFVRPDGYSKEGQPLTRIYGKAERYSAMCRTTTGVAYPRHRPIYRVWYIRPTIEINGAILTEDQAVNLIAMAGRWCGVGEWRPTAPKSMTGDFGRFKVEGLPDD